MDDLKNLTLLIPVALGLVGHFGIFIDSRSVFRDRVAEVHKSLKENLTQFMTELLEYAHSIQDETLRDPLVRPELRGGGSSPDRVMRYTSETWRTFDLLTKIARASFHYKVGLYVLFLTTWFSVALFVCTIVVPQYSALILRVGLAIIILQGVALVALFVTSNSFDKYERAS